MRLRAGLFLSLLLAPSLAFGSIPVLFNQAAPSSSTYFVNATGGNDNNSCETAKTVGTPKATIAAGLACLSPGDTLTIKAGTYTEGIQDNAIPNGINNANHTIVKAASGETVILNGEVGVSGGTSGTTALLWIFGGSFITIQDIIFDCDNVSGNCMYLGRAGGFPPLSNPNPPTHHIKLIGCEVRDTPNFTGIANGFNQDGLVDTSNSFINVKSHHHGLQSATPTLHHGLYLTGQNNLVDGGEYYNNSGHGINAYAHDIAGGNSGTIIKNARVYSNGTQGIGIYDGSNIQVLNNVAHGNATGGGTAAGIRVGLRSLNAALYHNTVYSNSSGYGIWVVPGGSAVPTGTVIRNNIAYLNPGANIRNEGAATTLSNNLIGIDPLFVNAGSADFNLQTASPAIGYACDSSAVPNCNPPATDRDGETRSIPFDAGAHEFVDATQSVTLFVPNGGESWTKTVQQTISWSSANITNVRIRADRGNDGTFEETITASTASDGLFDWTPGGTANANTKLEICDAADNNPCAVSAAVFAITDAAGGTLTKRISDNTVGTKIGDIPGTSDSRIEQDFPTSNFGGAASLSVHKRTASDHSHSVLGFPGLSQITSNPNVTATVTNVKVGLWLRSVSGTNTHTINFRKLLRNNPEYQRTWNNASTSVAWTTPGGLGSGTDRVNAVSGQITGVGTALQFYEVNQSSGGLVDDVQDWLDDPSTNFGWHLELDGTGEDNNAKSFQSKEFTNGQRPFLEVTYTLTESTITVSLPTDTHVYPADLLVVRWQSQGVSGDVKVELSRNDGLTYESPALASGIPVTNPDLGWVVSGASCEKCRVKITSLNNTNVFGVSPAFRIAGTRVVMR